MDGPAPSAYRAESLPSTPGYRLDMRRLRARCWWVTFGSALIALLSLVAAWAQATRFVDFVPAAPSWAHWLAGDEGFLFTSAIMLATTIAWLAWLYRAVANLKAVSASAMTYGPVAAVVWCLIPIVSLVMQFFVVRAVWHGTVRRADTAPLLVVAWAASFLAPAVVALLPAMLAGNIEAYDIRAEAFANVLQAVSSALTAVLTYALTRAQDSLTDISETFA